MSHLSEQDYQKVLTFLYGLYNAQSFNEFTTYICGNILNLVAGELPGYVTADFEKRQIIPLSCSPVIPGFDDIVGNHFYEHPFSQHYAKTLDLRAIKISDFMSREQLLRSEPIYQRYMRYIGMEENMTLSFLLPCESSNSVCANLNGSSLKVDSIGIFRQDRSFTERDRILLNLLQPHLMQARQTAQSFTQLQQTQKKLQDCLETAGSILIGQEGRVHTMTQKAERLLKQYFHDFEHFSCGLPERLKQWVKYQRSLLTSHNGSLKPLSPLKVEQGNKLLNVRFAADISKDQYLLFLSEQKRPVLSAELLETLGLSHREAEVLFLIMDGKTNPEIASALHLSISTVRKHLEHIYFKLGVQTRAAAVVSAFKKLGVLNLDWAADSSEEL
jgi:DNA-binding CsgD family transcriptional regulator